MTANPCSLGTWPVLLTTAPAFTPSLKAEAIPAKRSFSLCLVRLRPKRTYGLMTQRGSRRAIGVTVIRWPPAAIGANGWPLFGPGDAESFHLPTHCGTFHPKAGRGPLRAAQHPAGLAESADDMLPLRVSQRDCRGGRFLNCRGRGLQVAERNLK